MMYKILSFTLVSAALIAFGCSDDETLAPEQPLESTNPVLDFANQNTVGSSRLVRNSNGILMELETSDIPPDYALTAWWVIFNKPEECAALPCVSSDISNAEVEADVLYADGNVTGNGKVKFQAMLDVGDTSQSARPQPVGLLDPLGAEVHLVVRSHGPSIPGQVAEQIGSLAGGCTTSMSPPEVPDAVGECANIHFSIHQP